MSPTPIKDPNAPPDPSELRDIPTYQNVPDTWVGTAHNPVPPGAPPNPDYPTGVPPDASTPPDGGNGSPPGGGPPGGGPPGGGPLMGQTATSRSDAAKKK